MLINVGRTSRRGLGAVLAATVAVAGLAQAPVAVADPTGPVDPKQPAATSAPLHDEADPDEKAVAAAAAWSPDPKLFTPLATDSPATVAARQALASVATHLREVLKTYDAAHAVAEAAQRDADAAHDRLQVARRAAAAAAAQYEKDRLALTEIINNTYATGSIGTLGLVMSADTGQDLVSGMSLLQQVGMGQAEAVKEAEKSAARLEASERQVADLDAATRAALRTARARLAEAETARDAVVEDVAEANQLLTDSVLADEAAAAAKAAAAAAAKGALMVSGTAATEVVFPLVPGSVFRDQGNWGRSGGRWSSVHTGNDFSAACGTGVRAATSGTVMVRSDQGWSGPWLVTVTTGEGRLTTWYAHMETIAVSDGQTVTAGQALGTVGDQGNSFGCHLHFEVHPAGGSIYEDHTDPVEWLRASGAYPGS